MARLFGTDGIRAVAGEYPLDRATIWRIGRALAGTGGADILIGRDTRESGRWIEAWLSAGVRDARGRCVSAGVIPTPGLAYLTAQGSFEAGVMISASHNPYQDNGIKIFSGSGLKQDDPTELEVERRILEDASTAPEHLDSQTLDSVAELRSDYLEFLEESVAGSRFDGLRIAIDAANGAGFDLAPRIFKRLGATVHEVATQPDGCNINRDCGALHPEGLAARVTDTECNVGLALDGDADRAILIDAKGQVFDGDHLLLILARELLGNDQLQTRTVVGTVMANMGLEVALRKEGLQFIRTQVGDRYVLEEMERGTHDLGGEQSGHIILRRTSSTGDGILVGLQVAAILVRTGRSLLELSKGMRKYPQTLINVPVREKPDFMEISRIRKAIEEAEAELATAGRILIRYSGTETMVRVMVEGADRNQIGRLGGKIADLFHEELG